MQHSSLPRLRCPVCKGVLNLEIAKEVGAEVIEGRLNCDCGHSYPIQDGIVNFIYPHHLLPSDEEFQQKYNKGAEKYDIGMEWLFNSFYEDEQAVRRQMVELLDIAPGACVLDIGCGTGGDSLAIADYIESKGELYTLDLSISMVQIAKNKLAKIPMSIEYFLGNAAYLPFADGTFDALLHFGGLNTFGEISKAIAEMTRVVRPGGKVVIGDEGVPSWLRQKLFGKMLINANPLYKHEPPLDSLPENVREVCVRWILGNAFYLIDYRIGEGPPKLDIDLPIPGKGDSLRLRYYKSEAKH
jgi:ubiquinone/menaquinone biosynthesis C-methylase UbiE/uncharacterized protein YbaR (Trm112 family)